jgi:perosamine synthetase
MIPIAKPIFGEEEITAVQDVLESGLVVQGKRVEAFENAFADYCGVNHAVAVSNGTIALDVALKAMGIKEGDEVIVPDFTFIATANAILFQGAQPVFADVDDRLFTIAISDIMEKVTSKTKAILGVHLFGHPFDIKAIRDICDDHGLLLLEDCAQAHGAEYGGERVGCFGELGCFSFYATKNMTTGEGGMITTNNAELAQTCRLLRNHGERQKYYHEMLGYNYRMTELQAAIGLVQLKKLEDFNEARMKNADFYSTHLQPQGLKLPTKKEQVKHVYHQYAVTVEDDFPRSRDALMQYLRAKDIGSAIHYPLSIHNQPLYHELGYTDESVRCPVATALARKILSLPVHPAVSDEELEYITETINLLGGTEREQGR